MDDSTRVGIVHYGCGNIYNVKKSLKKIGLDNVSIIEDGSLSEFDVLVLPGVGSFKNAMNHLLANNYDKEILEHVKCGKKLLCICLGMQLLMSESEEMETTKGLNILKGGVVNLSEFVENIPMPHVGLNSVVLRNEVQGKFYFDHSYKVVLEDSDENMSIGITTYGGHEFISYLQKDSITAVQFHPEMSGELGMRFLTKFFNKEV